MLAHLAAIAQIVILFVLPWFGRPIPVVPSAEVRARGDRHLAALEAIPGPVFLPWHGYTARMVGKPPTAHSMAIYDIWRSGNRRVIDRFNAALSGRLTTVPYPVIYIDDVDARGRIGHDQLRELIMGAGYRRDLGVRIEELPLPVGVRGLFPRGVWRR